MDKDNQFPGYIYDLERMLIYFFRNLKEQHVQDAAEVKLSMPQFVCLWVISKLGKFKMSDLASYLSLSYASATNLINRLVEAGLIIRYDDSEDRRIVMVELSEKGKELIRFIREKHLKELTANCENLSEQEREEMIKGFKLLIQIMIKKQE